MKVTGWHGRKWKNTWFLGVCLGIAVVVIAGIVLIQQVEAAGRRTYELRIYHASK
jgi:low affinity Fe/Cu permease